VSLKLLTHIETYLCLHIARPCLDPMSGQIAAEYINELVISNSRCPDTVGTPSQMCSDENFAAIYEKAELAMEQRQLKPPKLGPQSVALCIDVVELLHWQWLYTEQTQLSMRPTNIITVGSYACTTSTEWRRQHLFIYYTYNNISSVISVQLQFRRHSFARMFHSWWSCSIAFLV